MPDERSRDLFPSRLSKFLRKENKTAFLLINELFKLTLTPSDVLHSRYFHLIGGSLDLADVSGATSNGDFSEFANDSTS